MKRLLLFLLFAAGACAQPHNPFRFFSGNDTLAPTVDSLRSICYARTPDDTAEVPGAVQDYFDYYRLNFSTVTHRFGGLPVPGGTLAVHTYLPAQPHGTVLAVHGYLTHSGTLDHLIGAVLEAGFAVAAMDMPGHGLSGGRRGAVDDFATYAAAFEQVLAFCRERLPGPYAAVAHSTGGAAVLEYLFTRDDPGICCVVLAAPLVRSVLWKLTKAGYAAGGGLLDEVPRVMMTKVSSDPEYLAFLRQYDPLQLKTVPTDWVRALYAWDERQASYPHITVPVLLLQGNHDTVVDADYNVPFLREKIPSLQVEMIDDGRHELFNEREELREGVLEKTVAFLKTNIQHPTSNVQRSRSGPECLKGKP